MLESKKVNQCNKRAWMRIFRFLTLSLSHFLTSSLRRRRRRYQGEGASHSFELRVMSFELGVLLTRCVVEARAFRKPEGRGAAKGRAEESRGNCKF
jgi:hypothetical protein